jgi:cell division septation protein DedD
LQHKRSGVKTMWKSIMFAAALMAGPAALHAQSDLPVNPVYRRAQTLVNDGNAAQGRALVDSMIAAAAPGSTEYAEGLFWRAVLAATAAEAEADYRRVVNDFPYSLRIEDALIRLAQLEIARGNYDAALTHLNQLAREHPASPARARASYWTARTLFDKNDLQGGCIAVADALSRTGESDTELRNQINYLNQRCAGVSLTPPASAAVANPTATVPADSTIMVQVPVDRTTPPPVTTAPPPIRPSAPVTPPAAAPVIEKPAPQPPPVIKPADEPTRGTSERVWSVQVAAYNVKSQADASVARLKKNGYEARVDGTSAPFRVRIGKYTTHGQASAVQRSLKAKKIDGFVVQADIQ